MKSLKHPDAPKAMKIKIAVAKAFAITIKEMDSKQRPERITLPRQIAMTLISERTSLNLNEVGTLFGKDHGTVLHAKRTVSDRCETETRLRITVEQLRAAL